MKKFVSTCLLSFSVLAAGAASAETVRLTTNMGVIDVQLADKQAPISTQNFVRYVNEHFYDGTIFHRVIPDFMIQGGGMTQDLNKKENHAPIKLEANTGLKNVRGSIAMARTNDPNSATSQFFINLKDNSYLDGQYAVFGKVTAGMNVVDKIADVDTGNSGFFQNVPKEPVIIEKAEVLAE
ncbi:peptidylprolyl isomerase [Pokkaliibacter sp. CJK22405]|uniref:peptidylprolyl isomerase n=1 Tax=Pokkaliibacter sp. CJK22405 TaxID=3384615 RepID=UPI003984DF35